MEQLIPHGLASHYFVTDPKQALAIVESPLVLSSSGELRFETFANVFSKCVFAFQKTSFWHHFLKLANKVTPGSPEAIQKTNLWLQHLEQDSCLPFSGRLLAPLFVLSNGIEDRCLRILKRLRVRGTQIFAVDISTNSEPLDFMINFDKNVSGSEVAKGEAFRLIEPNPSVIIVAGLHESVLSSEGRVSKILTERKELIGSFKDLNTAESI